MKTLLRYLNPIRHLGDKHYSFMFPLLATAGAAVLLEMYAYFIAKNPEIVGLAAIIGSIVLVIYFAFREGVRGGVVTTITVVGYYLYIIYTRHYRGSQLVSGLETTALLGGVYMLMAWIIGWLKQTIDTLIEREADQRKRLETIIQQLPVGVMITDSQGTVVQVNKKIDTMLGMKFPIGVSVHGDPLVKTQVNGKPIGRSKGPLAKVLATGKPSTQEVAIERKDGGHAYLHISASGIHNRAGKLIAAASIISDVTHQKEMEKRKDDFVNMASHELKTPITSMKLYTELLMRRITQYGDGKAVKILDNISDQMERLQKLVNDLLDVSRLQTGKLSFSKEEFRLDLLVKEIVDVLQGATPNQSLVYRKHTPIIVYADKFRIYQVITNLITNAAKYSPNGQKILVDVYKQQSKAVVSIQDFGIGIAKNQQKKIFERLYQVTDDKEKTFPGFGMGLYISKEIVTRHNGSIWVTSEKGKGSIFYFSLPIGGKR